MPPIIPNRKMDTPAGQQAVLGNEAEVSPLRERVVPLRQRIARRPLTGLEADKAFYDSLSGDEETDGT